MGKKSTILVRLVSLAGTGLFYTLRRKRGDPKLTAIMFDRRVKARVLFSEKK